MTIFICFILFPFSLHAQIISTIVGNGTKSNTGDGGPATAATINYPCGGVFDKFGNYYFGLGDNGCSVRKISTSGIITTVAGINGNCGYGGDGGPATAAILKNVQAVTVDTYGNLYIADADQNNRIRKVDITTGIITTIAGTGVGGYNGDGVAATSAQIYSPTDLSFDKSGNLYFADPGNARVRKINTSGIIFTVAGNGVPGYGNTGVPATSVSINTYGICFDNSGDLYIADWHARVYKVNTDGIISYFAGNGISGYGGDGGLALGASTNAYHIAMDKYDNLFIAEYQAGVVRMVDKYGYINTIAGTGIRGYNGDNILAAKAELYTPIGIALDSCDNLYIADLDNYRIRKIAYSKCNYLAVPEVIKAHELFIYPNPTYDILNINNLKDASTYILQSIIGATVLQGALKEGNNSINIQAVPNGMYMLVIVDSENGKKVVNTIIKQ